MKPTMGCQGGHLSSNGQDKRVKYKSKEDRSHRIALLNTRRTGKCVSAKLEEGGGAIAPKEGTLGAALPLLPTYSSYSNS